MFSCFAACNDKQLQVGGDKHSINDKQSKLQSSEHEPTMPVWDGRPDLSSPGSMYSNIYSGLTTNPNSKQASIAPKVLDYPTSFSKSYGSSITQDNSMSRDTNEQPLFKNVNAKRAGI